MRTALAIGLLAFAAPAFAETCNLPLAGELMIQQAAAGLPILVQASIRGQPIAMTLDTGSPATSIDRATAEKFGLELRPESRIRMRGIGGDLRVFRVTVPDFKLGPQLVEKVDMLVIEGMRTDARQMTAGLLGQNVLGEFDLELDVQGHRLALYDKTACAHAPPWPQESVTIPLFGNRAGRIRFEVKLDGRALNAELDSGAARTLVTWAGARKLGLSSDSPGVEAQGNVVGADGKPLPRSFYRFGSFELEGETIRNPRLSIVDFHRTQRNPDMMLRSDEPPDLYLGADWLRAHRVYVARAAGEMHFTYLGGPVFEK